MVFIIFNEKFICQNYIFLFYFSLPQWYTRRLILAQKCWKPIGGGDSEPDHLTLVDGKLFFSAKRPSTDSDFRRVLWVKETVATEAKLVNPTANTIDKNSSLIPFNNILLYTAYGVGSSMELWRSDATQNGTYKLKTLQNSSNFMT